nr:xylanolytic transcriptional activator xlnr [Quercus suber]
MWTKDACYCNQHAAVRAPLGPLPLLMITVPIPFFSGTSLLYHLQQRSSGLKLTSRARTDGGHGPAVANAVAGRAQAQVEALRGEPGTRRHMSEDEREKPSKTDGHRPHAPLSKFACFTTVLFSSKDDHALITILESPPHVRRQRIDAVTEASSNKSTIMASSGMFVGADSMVAHRQHTSPSGLDVLVEGSQYALQQLQNERVQEPHLNATRPHLKHRTTNSSGSNNDITLGRHETVTSDARGEGTGNGAPVRRRISRACDQCNQLRTKCDGKFPCAHCVEVGLSCEYARARKKRGKASRKDIAAQLANTTMSGSAGDGSGGGSDRSPPSLDGHSSADAQEKISQASKRGTKRRRSVIKDVDTRPLPAPRSNSQTLQTSQRQEEQQQQQQRQHQQRHQDTLLPSLGHLSHVPVNSMGDQNGQERQSQQGFTLDPQTPGAGLPNPRLPSVGAPDRNMPVVMGDYGTIDDYHRSILHPNATVAGHSILHSGSNAIPNSMIHGGSMNGYGEGPYGATSPNSQMAMSGGPFRVGESPVSAGFLGQSPLADSPGWLPLPAPFPSVYSHSGQLPQSQTLRYPVLRPLLSHISAIIPIALACDLLELYFSSTSPSFLQPSSPYIHGFVFRKRSFLRQQNPRICSPALLASMLWVAAQTSESAFLTSPPSARGKICQKLLELTYGLLKPLIHSSNDTPGRSGMQTVVNGVALGGFGVALGEMEGVGPGATGSLDDVATYLHLATVVSASEYKAASLRWWNAAWSLARELKLGRELPSDSDQDVDAGPHGEYLDGSDAGRSSVRVNEEEREERRRIWWMLYIVDRHLCLCYNKPLFLLDIECSGLLQPEDELIWQTGDFYPPENHRENLYFRSKGPVFECTGYNLFSHFLPIMTILGEIVDMKIAREHPHFGHGIRNPDDWQARVAVITDQIDRYEQSLKDFEARHAIPPASQGDVGEGGRFSKVPTKSSPSGHSGAANYSDNRMTSTLLRSRIVVAYGTHLLHTMHILLNGKWDPISLLDDNDLWISSESFVSATGHAVAAAAAIDDILEYDPDLSFMPWFFGIYLLQGSFLLLLIADKLQGEASPNVVKACETIVRAHEACVVTLNTEYQVCCTVLLR